MRISKNGGITRRRREAKILIVSAMLLPVLLGMVGLVIDGGIMMASYRQVYNAADAAALAAAMDKARGKSNADAIATATVFVKEHNKLAKASPLTINIPPASGPYAGDSKYVEAIIGQPVTTTFIHILKSVKQEQSVTARAVAGVEPVSPGQGVITLGSAPKGGKGLQVTGGATLSVDGGILVNAEGGSAGFATNNSVVQARDIQVVGGVNNPDNFKAYTSGDRSPLNTGATPAPDPLENLAAPTTASGVNPTVRSSTVGKSGTTTFNPGIYTSDISVSNGNTVVFNEGIYVFKGASLKVTGGSVSTAGKGAMFYLTSSKYDPASGDPGSAGSWGSLSITGGTVNMSQYSNSASPYDGMLFFQNRDNASDMKITGNSAVNVKGTVYAKSSELSVSGQGDWNTQFIVGSTSVSGQGKVSIKYAGQNLAKANQPFLVE